MLLTEIIDKIKARISLRKQEADAFFSGDYKDGVKDTLEFIEYFLNSTFLEDKSTGAIRKTREIEIEFRGSSINLLQEYYETPNHNLSYTTTELDDDFMWRVFKEWCNQKHFTTFREICPEVVGKVAGYVARDRSGQLLFFDNLPYCIRSEESWDTDCECFPLPKDFFPDVTYENSPRRVNLLIENDESI